MSNSILTEIKQLKTEYNNKMKEYDLAVSEHKDKLDRYKTICDLSSFKECANERERCEFSGIKTVRYGADSTFKYDVFENGTNCSNAVFGDPVPGVKKKCYVAPTACEHPDEFNPTVLQASSNKISTKIRELKEIELKMRSKIKQLLGYRDEWATDFSNQEQCLFSRLEKLDNRRDRLVDDEIASSNNVEGQFDNLNFQIQQSVAQYSLWAGITVLSGIALYLVVKKKSGGEAGAVAKPGFKLNIGQR